MENLNSRAFKEWAVACEAIRSGEQTILIRKGGVREVNGVFTMTDRNFLLMPTYEHQKAELLQSRYVSKLHTLQSISRNPNIIEIDTYVEVEKILTDVTEESLARVENEFPWNSEYVKLRFDFNPYDPLFVILLRAYTLPKMQTVPMRQSYQGCKSWVDLETPLSLEGMSAVLTNEEHDRRQNQTISMLTTPNL